MNLISRMSRASGFACPACAVQIPYGTPDPFARHTAWRVRHRIVAEIVCPPADLPFGQIKAAGAPSNGVFQRYKTVSMNAHMSVVIS